MLHGTMLEVRHVHQASTGKFDIRIIEVHPPGGYPVRLK